MVPSCSLQVGAGEGQVETTILPASREGHAELDTGLMLSVPTLQEATGYGEGKLRSLGPCACQANALHPQDDKVPAP